MDLDVAIAIDAESEAVSILTRAADTYDSVGDLVPGAWTTVAGRAAVQPANGRMLEDFPEGIRSEVTAVAWTRSEVADDNRIVYRGVTYRVLGVRPRPMDGFTRVALGRIQT